MQTHYLNIASKHRRHAGYAASLNDFSVTEGELVQPEVILANPNISLYTLDDEHHCAIFAELAPGVDLLNAPFVYYAQYEAAQRLIAVPYPVFIQLAQQLPSLDHLIMIYMNGRSGSTLFAKVLNEVDDVVSLSEPDAPIQFIPMRAAYAGRENELIDLLRATIRFCFKPLPLGHKESSIFALKLRSEALLIMDLVQMAFPKVKNVYLYRDLIGWVASFYRVLSRFETPKYTPIDEWVEMSKATFSQDFSHLLAYLTAGTTQLTLIQHLTLWFLGICEWYTASTVSGIPILPFRYADLNMQPEKILTHVFEYLGLPTSAVQQTLKVFDSDSQAGTPLGRDNPQVGNQQKLSDEQIAEINAILSVYPHIKESDFIVPNTLQI